MLATRAVSARLSGSGRRAVSNVSAKDWRLGRVFPDNARRPEPRLASKPVPQAAGDAASAAAGSASAASGSARRREPGPIAPPPSEPRSISVYTTKQRACDLAAEDAGTIHRIRDYKKAFPEGIAGKVDFEEEADLGIMHRREAVEIIDAIRAMDEASRAAEARAPGSARATTPGFCLTGSRGMGKSYILNAAVQAATERGWLVFFVPELFSLVEGRFQHQRSPTRQGMWDIPEVSQMFLKNFEARNKALLEKLPRTLQWPYGDIDKNLLGYTRLGIEELEAAPEALCYLIEEAKAVTSVPVLFALDQFNVLYAMTKGYWDEEVNYLPPHIFTCFRPFVQFPQSSLKNGMMIVATSENWPWHKAASIRKALLTSPLSREVTPLTRQELQILLARYRTVGGMYTPLDRPHVNEVWAYTGGLPGDLLRAAAASGAGVPLDDEDVADYSFRLRKGVWK